MEVTQGALVGKRLGNYELLALLAIGGTAEIYLARIGGEAGFEKYVVVKCLLDHLADEEEYIRMFLDEARLGAQLDHSNIVQTLELGEHDGRYFMAMEYLAGMSLAQLARKTNERVAGGKLPVELTLGLAAQTCAGLHYAHRKQTAHNVSLNLVHRDISPQNLVVSFDGVLKIVDFGIAKADFRETHTQSGTIKGKFAYMSPEQCLAKEVDFRTDIFALGVILHELLTARRLFKRTTTYETYEAIIKGDVPTPSSVNPDLDSALDEVIMKALRYNKADRYDSAETLGQALLGVLHKRGRAVNASDIAGFYEKHFEAELREHHMRMRALITGKQASAIGEESINWDAAGAGEISEEEIELDPDSSMIEEIESIDAGDPIERGEPSSDGKQATIPESGATRIEEQPRSFSPRQPPITTATDPDRTNVGESGGLAPGGPPPGGGPTIRDVGPPPGGGPTIRDVGPPPGGGPTIRDVGHEAPRGGPPPAHPVAGPMEKTIAPGQMISPLAPKIATEAPKGRAKKRDSRRRPTIDLGPKSDDLEPLEALDTIQNMDSPVSGEFEVPTTDSAMPVRSPSAPPLRGPSSEIRASSRAGDVPGLDASARRTVLGVSPFAQPGPIRPTSRPGDSSGRPDRPPSVPPLAPPAGTPPQLRSRPGTGSSPSTQNLYSAPPPRDPGPARTPGPSGPLGPMNQNPPVGDARQAIGASAERVPVPPDTLPPIGERPPGSGGHQPLRHPSSGGPSSSAELPHLQPPQQRMRLPSHVIAGKRPPELWLLGLVFAISVGIGLGATLLIASLG